MSHALVEAVPFIAAAGCVIGIAEFAGEGAVVWFALGAFMTGLVKLYVMPKLRRWVADNQSEPK